MGNGKHGLVQRLQPQFKQLKAKLSPLIFLNLYSLSTRFILFGIISHMLSSGDRDAFMHLYVAALFCSQLSDFGSRITFFVKLGQSGVSEKPKLAQNNASYKIIMTLLSWLVFVAYAVYTSKESQPLLIFTFMLFVGNVAVSDYNLHIIRSEKGLRRELFYTACENTALVLLYVLVSIFFPYPVTFAIALSAVALVRLRWSATEANELIPHARFVFDFQVWRDQLRSVSITGFAGLAVILLVRGPVLVTPLFMSMDSIAYFLLIIMFLQLSQMFSTNIALYMFADLKGTQSNEENRNRQHWQILVALVVLGVLGFFVLWSMIDIIEFVFNLEWGGPHYAKLLLLACVPAILLIDYFRFSSVSHSLEKLFLCTCSAGLAVFVFLLLVRPGQLLHDELVVISYTSCLYVAVGLYLFLSLIGRFGKSGGELSTDFSNQLS